MGEVRNGNAEEDWLQDLNPVAAAMQGEPCSFGKVWNYAVLGEPCTFGVPFAMRLRKLGSKM